jgi:DNA-binding CsgD family transcriptional regulator
MRQTDHHPAPFPLEQHATPDSQALHQPQSRDLSDREAVIAVMVANGSDCKSVSVRLALPLRTVQGYLHRALAILDIRDVEDLTYAIVAAHYNRNAPANRPGHPEADDSPASDGSTSESAPRSSRAIIPGQQST